MKELFETVLDRMVEKGWLHSYTLTVGKGYWRNWTPSGAEKIAVLAEIVTAFNLTADDRSSIAFYEAACGRNFPGVTVTINDESIRPALDFFADCVDALGLKGEDELLTLAHIAVWDLGNTE